MQTATLSESALATLRLHVEGEPAPARERNRAAYRELVEAGIMEVVPGAERSYRLTAEGREHRDAILERETERIERALRSSGREPPVGSGQGIELLRRLISARVEVTPENRPAFRELAVARIILLGVLGYRVIDRCPVAFGAPDRVKPPSWMASRPPTRNSST
jgi:hypothetical protein